MKISVHGMSVQLFITGLTNLAAILRKGKAHAEARKIEAGVLEGWRLAPDMFNFCRQVQLACDFAKNSTARLAGVEPPKFPDEEKTFDELIARVEKTIEYLRTVKAGSVDGSEDRDIKVPLRTRTLEMKGLPFLQDWALPNFYFHVVAAYTLLRHNGVEIGKSDYLGGI
jgi:hypothetical protein